MRRFRLRKKKSAKQHGVIGKTPDAKWDQAYAADDKRPHPQEFQECWPRRVVASKANLAGKQGNDSAQNAGRRATRSEDDQTMPYTTNSMQCHKCEPPKKPGPNFKHPFAGFDLGSERIDPYALESQAHPPTCDEVTEFVNGDRKEINEEEAKRNNEKG